MKRIASLGVLAALVALLGMPATAAGDAECGCPRGACLCPHGESWRSAPPACHTELRLQGSSCEKRPVREALPSPALPDGELAAPGARAERRPATPPPPAEAATPTRFSGGVESPPPRA